MAKLSGRLRQLRELRERGDEGNISTAVPISGKTTRDGHGVGEMQAEILSGWKQTAPYVWRKKSVLTLTATEVNLPGLLLDDLHDLHRLTFYDFETTGLSRGAGTVIFLAGFGVLKGLLSESPTLEVEQLLLTDYPGEPEFLHCLLPFLGTDRIFVSYNGKSFDRSILQNRFRMNGIREDMPAQLDLLYPSRRLWGRVLESCSLQYIEREILGFIRTGDIGGALIPECYQDFIRGAGGGCMRGVMEHHLRDIHSLAELLFFIEALPAKRNGPGEAGRGRRVRPEEKTGLGVLLLKKAARGAITPGTTVQGAINPGASAQGAITLFEEALEEGDDKAGKHLVLHYKRCRMYDDLERVLKKMLRLGNGHFQIIEMAKLFEHYHRRPDLARDILSLLPTPKASLSTSQYESFVYRKKRLSGKIFRDS